MIRSLTMVHAHGNESEETNQLKHLRRLKWQANRRQQKNRHHSRRVAITAEKMCQQNVACGLFFPGQTIDSVNSAQNRNECLMSGETT